MVLSPESLSAGSAPDASGAAAGLRAALRLLLGLQHWGLRSVVVCPGSRSAPLAVAAGLLQSRGLTLKTALDERSASFFALGLGRANGRPAAVVTTSGSAVAQLLPACVEADHGAIPLLLITADRPDRLKGCGANQSVNQEEFLRCSCRWVGQGSGAGLAGMATAEIDAFARTAYLHAIGRHGPLPAGAVHLNLPFEEPLHVGAAALQDLAGELAEAIPTVQPAILPDLAGPNAGCRADAPELRLDPDLPGVVVAGPWRGDPLTWNDHLEALIRWQERSGWPVLADPLSGLRGQPRLFCVAGYDLLLENPEPVLAPHQVLRLGTLPASRRLERWLLALGVPQVLVSEGEPRPRDPLGVVTAQTGGGLQRWLHGQGIRAPGPSAASRALAEAWALAEGRLQHQLDQLLSPAATAEPWSEPALARQLSRLLPAGLPLMLANSSPVRDWESFADPGPSHRPVFGFRGASGIDGTLSEACGLAEALGSLLLLSGDLALLHDCNGWLWRPQLRGRLTLVVIDNGGGGIFEQLPIRLEPEALLDFERLFAMPQPIDPMALAAAHGVPCRCVASPADLADALAWALAQPFSLLVVRTDRRRDAALRRRLRTMAANAASG